MKTAFEKNRFTDYMVDRGAALVYRWIRIPKGQRSPEQIRCFNTSSMNIGPDTNLLYANRFSPPDSYIVRSIHSYWDERSEQEDRNALLCNYHLDLQIGQKSYFRSPLIALTQLATVMPELGDGPLPDGPIELSEHANVDVEIERGQIIPGAFGEYPRYIPPMTFFDVILTGEPFTTKADVAYCVVLNGWMDRGVQ